MACRQRYLIFPGRHLVLTRFHETHLASLVRAPSLENLPWRDHPPAPFFRDASRLDRLVFAITSCNQPATCRFNPLPFHVRAIGADRFGRLLREQSPLSQFSVLGIPHYRNTDNFASFMLNEIVEQTGTRLSPENTAVLCGTESVLNLWRDAGFGTLPCELTLPPEQREYPADVVVSMSGGKDAQTAVTSTADLATRLSSATLSTFDDYPEVVARMKNIFREPLITDAGSLTADRNYESYTYGMSNPDIMELKMAEIRPFLSSQLGAGRLVDEGCADGALLVRLSKEAPDACLLGVDLSSEFLAMCAERQRRGDFGGSFVHFHQRNLLNPIFEDRSIDVTIANSTTHEIWSYATQATGLREYLRIKHRQTRRGGRLVIRDVVGPAGPDASERQVILRLRRDNGSNDDNGEGNRLPTYGDAEKKENAAPRAELAAHLKGLSTAARFHRFARDFNIATRGRRRPFAFVETNNSDEEKEEEWQSFSLSLQDAAEFMSKFEYTDNWASEMNEEFAFWSFDEWKQELTDAGWTVVEGSRAYASQWQIDNRFTGRMQIFDAESGEGIPWPNTNMILVGEREAI